MPVWIPDGITSLLTGSLLFGSALDQEHGDIVTNNDSAYHAAEAATPGERPRLNDLDLSPQGLADSPASEVDTDSLVYAGNS